MATNLQIQTPTRIVDAIETDGKISNIKIIMQFDNDMRLMYNKIIELEARIVVLEGA